MLDKGGFQVKFLIIRESEILLLQVTLISKVKHKLSATFPNFA